MNPKIMVWASVALSAVAQIFLKHGLNRVVVYGGRSPVALLRAASRQSSLWAWAGCFTLATALWLLALERLDLSYAYPLLSVGYILVNLLSMFFFRERVNGARWLAVGVISIGVVLIAGS